MNGREIETKLRIQEPEVMALRLAKDDRLHLSRARHLERNLVLDNSAGQLKEARKLLRLRFDESYWTLTVKGPGEVKDGLKSRAEWETRVEDGDTLFIMLNQLGYKPVFTYEKYRTIYHEQGGLIITFDETPMGAFIELEGEPEAIHKTRARLGFAADEGIGASYRGLWKKWLEERGEQFRDMIFP